MMRSKKLLPLAFVALLLLPACELVDAVKVAVSGPECGSFGLPPEIADKNLYPLAHRFDWDRNDELIAVLAPHEHSHGPDVLFALGFSYVRKALILSNDPAYFRRGVRLLRWAALCGDGAAAGFLSYFYKEGLMGVEKNPELAACLERSYDPHKIERALIAGRVWRCGVRVDDLPE